MMRRSTLLAPLGLLAIHPALAATIEAKSRIEQVVLYPDAAIITRQVAVDIPAGSHEVVLPDLPAGADPASLRVEAAGTSRLVIGGIDFRLGVPDRAGDSATQARLKSLREEREKVQDRIDAAEGRKAMIQKLAQRETPLADAKGFDLESWLKAVEAVGRGLQAVNDDLRGLRREESRLDEEIALLEATIGQPKNAQVQRVAAIAVEANEAAKATLSVSYRIAGASWRPVYDARLDTRGAKPALELTRRALIRQRTGEDWRDARVTLSTLRIQRGTAAPVLGSERVTVNDPPPPPMPRSPVAGAPAPEAMMTMQAERTRRSAAKMDAEPAIEAEAAVQASAFQAEFTLPVKISLPSGQEERSFRLASEVLEPELAYKTAPALDATAYLEANLTPKGEAPLLAGEVLLTRDGAFVGRARVADTAQGDKLALGFGADERVKVTRVPVLREARDAGLFGSQRSEDRRFRTDIRNLHAFPVKVQIVDRLPVSEDQQITIERLPDMTKPDLETLEDRRGVFAWNATLAGGETKSFVTAWRVRWPQGKTLRSEPIPR